MIRQIRKRCPATGPLHGTVRRFFCAVGPLRAGRRCFFLMRNFSEALCRWLRLKYALRDGDLEAAAEAQRRLAELGVEVRLRSLRPFVEAEAAK